MYTSSATDLLTPFIMKTRITTTYLVPSNYSSILRVAWPQRRRCAARYYRTLGGRGKIYIYIYIYIISFSFFFFLLSLFLYHRPVVLGRSRSSLITCASPRCGELSSPCAVHSPWTRADDSGFRQLRTTTVTIQSLAQPAASFFFSLSLSFSISLFLTTRTKDEQVVVEFHCTRLHDEEPVTIVSRHW